MKRLYDRFASTWLGSMLFRSSESLYVRLSRTLFFLIVAIAMFPFLIQGIVAHQVCEKMTEKQCRDQLVWKMQYTQKSVDHFLEDHIGDLRSLFECEGVEHFNDQKRLRHIFSKLKKQRPDFVDIGLIDSTGIQKTYDGPYELYGKDYRDEYWFDEVAVRGSYISDVFLGYRQIPHVAIAIKSPPSDKGEEWILRATIDTKAFDKMVGVMNCGHWDDTFLINRKGFLQNSSRFHGNALSRLNTPIPTGAQQVVLTVGNNARKQKSTIAYTSLRNKDWILAFVQPLSETYKSLYAFRRTLSYMSIISFLGVFLLAMWITRNFVGRISEREKEHEAILHKAEHAGKLASIGRLAAGVAHEINNPMAVINEKAGLMKDLTEMSDDFAHKAKFLDLLGSIESTVVRCRTITHRLLGFARQMHVAVEVIDINALIREVLGFLEKEAFHRDIRIELDLPEDLPTIKSDRGRLQQVLLNVINNAMDAVNKGGEIRISSWAKGKEMVGIKIRDNGCGIPPDKLKRIFEPFYTTKSRDKGTGLGLSITYGIINKLGGKVSVESEVNKGTAFTIELPQYDSS